MTKMEDILGDDKEIIKKLAADMVAHQYDVSEAKKKLAGIKSAMDLERTQSPEQQRIESLLSEIDELEDALDRRLNSVFQEMKGPILMWLFFADVLVCKSV